jgi:hypothetical protein
MEKKKQEKAQIFCGAVIAGGKRTKAKFTFEPVKNG